MIFFAFKVIHISITPPGLALTHARVSKLIGRAQEFAGSPTNVKLTAEDICLKTSFLKLQISDKDPGFGLACRLPLTPALSVAIVAPVPVPIYALV